MALRRNDARRRRLVNDPTAQLGVVDVEGAGTASATPVRRPTGQPDARTYSYGADRRNQRKTTDLIPKRVIAYLIVVLALLTCLWAINFTSVRAHQWAGHIGQTGVNALAIRGPGSLAGWFSSFLLIMTGLASLQIYALRQHRCDDYRGTYRVWLWMAALMIAASIHCVTDLGTVAVHLIQSMSSDSIVSGSWVPLAFKLVVLSLLLGRGVFEVRQSRGSLALVVFVWIAFSFAAVMQLPVVQVAMVGLGTETLVGNSILFGTTALFLAHLTYARYIFLDAHGLIVHRIKTENVGKSGSEAELVATKRRKDVKKTASPPSKTKPANESTDSIRAPSPIGRQSSKTRKSQSVPPATVKPQAADRKPAARDKSPSDVLRELAAASRANEQARNRSTTQSRSFLDDEEDESVIQMSKAQKRKQRKLEKQKRRAA